MTRAERAALYRQCAAEGLTASEIARRAGVTMQAVYLWLKNHPDIQLAPAKPGPPIGTVYQKPALKAAVDALTPEQRADFCLLVDRGGYTHAAALESVTRPRVKAQIKVRRAG